MTLDGALQDDHEAIEKGLIKILPDDDHGRAVCFFDRTRMCDPHLTRGEVVSYFAFVVYLVSGPFRTRSTELSSDIFWLLWSRILHCNSFV